MKIESSQLPQSPCGREEINLRMKANTLKMAEWKGGKPGLDVFDLLN